MTVALLLPTLHFLPRTPSSLFLFNPKPSSSHTFPAARSPAHRPATAARVSSSTHWPFEQRMQEALHVLDLMETDGMSPDPSLFCMLLQSCAEEPNIEIGKAIHRRILDSKLQHDLFVANNLIKIQSDLPHEALRLYQLMKSDGEINPNAFTYSIALNSCGKVGDLKMGVEIHEDVVRDGCDSDVFIVTALIDMYSKCGRIEDACVVFNKMSEPSAAAFTAMIDGYNVNNQAKEAMILIRRILRMDRGMEIAKEVGFPCMIRACISELALRHGQEIHAHLIKLGCQPGANTITCLILLYEKCDKLGIARRLFNELLVKDVSLWGRMISGHVRKRLHREALELYGEMVTADVEPNQFVLSQVLCACVALYALEEGKEIHGRASKVGYQLSDYSMAANLVKLYARCGEFEEANKLKKLKR
ncbi:hypothetical protein ACLOJK_028638 [Asimina triloba]